MTEEEKRERRRKYQAEWRRLNPDRVKEKYNRWRAAHIESARENSRKWHLNNPERTKENKSRYYKENPIQAAIEKSKRRSRKIIAGGFFSVKEFEELKDYYDDKCLCCNKKELDVKLTPDHVLPLSRGGDNTISNIQPLCKLCNCKKHSKYIDYRPFIIELSQ